MALTKPRAYQIYDLDYKQSTRVITVSNVTLSGGAPSLVDGVTLSLNDRVLVTGQSTGSQNGLYYVTTVGSGSNGTWARSQDGNQTGEIDAGMIIMVTEGNTYADTQWKLITNDPIVIGTTALTFVQNYSANSISAGTSNVVVNSNANVTVSSAGTANVLIVTSTGSNVTGTLGVSGNVAGGNLTTAGQISATGTITSTGATNSTGFAVGNSAVSNVGLGFFPTAGTRGDYAIRDYSNVASTIYFDVGMGGSAAGDFQFRTSNAFTLVMKADSTGITTPGRVYALELNSTQSSGDEGGQLNLAKAATNTTLAGNIIVDIYQNKFRIFEDGGTNRGAFIDLTSCNASVGTNLLAGGGGGGTPGGSNTYVQFNDGGTFGGNASFTYDKVLNTLTAGTIAGTLNGVGQNFKVGDDAWIGDINNADTIGLKGQQNPANAYIVFGNSDATGKLGRAGTGPLTYAGAFSATANITGGNVLTGGIVSATGNISGGNVAAATALFSLGTVGASGNTSGGNLTTSGQVSSTGNVTGGNILTGGLISATGAITGASVVGGVMTGSSLSVTGAVTGASLVGTITTAAQTNITSVGTLSSLSVTANVQGGNIRTAGLISATGAITGASVVGGVMTGSSLSVSGAVTGASVVGGVMTGSSLSVTGTINGTTLTGTSLTVGTGNITGGNLLISGAIIDSAQLDIQTSAANANIAMAPNGTGMVTVSTQVSAVGNVTGGNIRTAGLISATGAITGASVVGGVMTGTSLSVSGAVTGSSLVGTITTAAQTNITSVGTLSSLSVTANVQGGNIRTAGLISATGDITGAAITGTSLTVSTGNITAGNLILSGAIQDSAQLDIQTTAANGNIVLTPNGTGVIVAAKDIRNGQATGVGNIGAAGATFNTIFAKATSAQYADLAEMYVADADYTPGTVVEFGGNYEITISSESHSTAVAGIVSTNPSYLMNSAQPGEHVLPVALTGRVPCQVQGPVRKGDVLVASSTPGVAQRIGMNWQPGCVLGKAMEVIDSAEIKTIEVAVGRF